ncbi:MAG: alanine racemase [Ruminococcaceae bacterium]|nr:alanine racemase [Oscillospiraceae bacterium]
MTSFIIERDKLLSNAKEIIFRAGDAKVFAVVKGNGYGFGTDEYIKLLHESGIRHFAVTDSDDAVKIRGMNLSDIDVLMLRSTSVTEEVEKLIENDIILTIGSLSAAEIANDISSKKEKSCRVHIKINTGMGRYGFLPDNYDGICSVFKNFPSIKVCGLFTHFSCAFKSESVTKKQLDAFLKLQNRLVSDGFDTGMVHFSNSAYLFGFKSPLGDAVRIGSAFTGRIANKPADCKLLRVGYLKSRICEIQTLPRGSTIGYGSAYTTKKEIKTAVVPVGYADGFNTEKVHDTYRFRDGIMYALSEIKRMLTKKTYYGKVAGKSCKILGHIGMTHTVLDVSDVPCNVGDEVSFDVNPIYISANIPREYI